MRNTMAFHTRSYLSLLEIQRNLSTGPTFHTHVAHIKVCLEFVGRAWFGCIEVIVGDAHGARATTGTVPIQLRHDVLVAAEKAERLLDTTTEVHASVFGHRHDDNLVFVACRSELLRLAVVLGIWGTIRMYYD